MKAGHFFFLLFSCAALGSCAASRPTTEDDSIFPDAGQYIGKNVRVMKLGTPIRSSELQLDSIADEPEQSYRARYETFAHKTGAPYYTIGLGSEISVSLRTSPTEKYYGAFSGFATDGVLATDTNGTQVYEYREIDTITEIATGKKLLRKKLIGFVESNSVPMRGVFYFTGHDASATPIAMTNSEFLDARVIYPVETAQAATEDNVGSEIASDLLDSFLGTLFSFHIDTNSDKKDDSKKNTKTGRINGEDRAKDAKTDRNSTEDRAVKKE
jgi:hypothetical protein